MYILIKYLSLIICVLNVLLFIISVEQFLNKMKMLFTYCIVYIIGYYYCYNV